MYAIVDIKGFQYRLEKGDRLKVPKYDLEVGKKLTIPEVLLFSSGKEIKVGTPYVEGVVVEATVTAQGKYPKIIVFKKKRRKDYSVKKGHRQEFTEIEINNIKVSRKSTRKAKPVKAEEAAAPAERPETASSAEESAGGQVQAE